jgi:hypothetical protein
MEKKMIRAVLTSAVLMILLSLSAVALFAETVKCIHHDWANCWSTGQYINDDQGHQFLKYECSCGDKVYVRQY